jgi:hypothetical protein
MADHFFSVNKGSQLDPIRVTVGTSTSGQSVELRVHDGDGHNTMSVNMALDCLQAFFSRSGGASLVP